MENFYVIIGLSPGTVGGDFLSIGLVVRVDGKLKFKFSSRKLKVASALFKTSKEGINWAVEQVAAKLTEESTRLLSGSAALFELQPSLKADFFEYLSRYSNGLIRFSSPKKLNAQGVDFANLFALLVDDAAIPEDAAEEPIKKRYSKEEFRERIELSLVLPLFETVHTDIRIGGGHFPELYFPIDVDCIGRNGTVQAAKSFDFENVAFSTSDKHWMHYFALLSVLDTHFPPGSKRKNHYYLIGDEPSDVNSEVHKQWEAILKSGRVEVVPSENARMVADRILESKATKFL